MSTHTAAELATRHHRATRFFWNWLLGATLASLAGNVAHALLTAPPATGWLAAAVATVPPTALLAAVHGIAVLVRADASGAVYRAAPGRDSVLSRCPSSRCAIWRCWPGSRRASRCSCRWSSTRRSRWRPSPWSLWGRSQRGDPAARPPPRLCPGPAARHLGSGPRPPARALPAPGSPPSATAELAAELVATKVTRQPAATVEAILEAHQKGDAYNRIAADLGVHHSAVKRVLEAAEAYRGRGLPLAG